MKTEQRKQYEKEYMKIYRITHKERLNELKRKWSNSKEGKDYHQNYRYNHKIETREYNKKYRELNKPKLQEYIKHYGVEYRKNNPRSFGHGNLDLQISMDNVRKRDNNTCQWYECGLTQREAPIHVHHIFPKSEYPELQLIEQYMICYCANHHGLWHRYRGDSNFLVNNLNKKEKLRGVICKHENCGKFITSIKVLSSKQRRCN